MVGTNGQLTKTVDSPRGDIAFDGKAIGVSGLNRQAGRINEEWLPQLKGRQGVEVFREMRDNDPISGAVLFAMEHTLRGVDWYVTAYRDADEDPTDEDEQNARFLESCMHDMSITWPDFIAETLSKLVFGWSYAEIVYKKRSGFDDNPVSRHNDGMIGWRAFAPRAQETLLRWEFDSEGELLGMVQNDGKGKGILIPLSRSLHFRTSSHKQNPEGRSLLRTSYTSYWTKKRIERFEAIGVERDLAGIPCIGVPPELFDKDADQDTLNALESWKTMGTSLRADSQACIVYPMLYDDDSNPLTRVELLSAPSSRLYDTTAIIERLARYQSMTMLQDVILLGHEHAGSLALADTKKRLARASLKSQADEIVGTINQYAIVDLFKLNGLDTERLPAIACGDIEERSLDTFAAMLSALSISGVMLDDLDTQNEIRSMMGLPQVTAEEMAARESARAEFEVTAAPEPEPALNGPHDNTD